MKSGQRSQRGDRTLSGLVAPLILSCESSTTLRDRLEQNVGAVLALALSTAELIQDHGNRQFVEDGKFG
jgi:hypothetical protein